MKLGNVVTNVESSNLEPFNIFERVEDINNDLPTLIIGYNIVKDNFPDYNMLNRKLGHKLFWTFTPREKRDINSEDIVKFNKFCFDSLTDGVQYIYVDPFNFSYNQIKRTITRIKTKEFKLYTFKYKNMLYLLSGTIIFGINLDVLEFLQITKKRLISKIKANSEVFLEDEEILIEYVNEMDYLNNEVKYIPLLYSMNNEK